MEIGIVVNINPNTENGVISHSGFIQVLTTKSVEDEMGNPVIVMDWGTPVKNIPLANISPEKLKSLIDTINQKLVELQLV